MDLKVSLAAVSVTTIDDVRGAAEALHEISMALAGKDH